MTCRFQMDDLSQVVDLEGDESSVGGDFTR